MLGKSESEIILIKIKNIIDVRCMLKSLAFKGTEETKKKKQFNAKINEFNLCCR